MVTTAGVTQFSGSGVAVPYLAASPVINRAWATAVSMLSAVGVLVTMTKVGVGDAVTILGGSPVVSAIAVAIRFIASAVAPLPGIGVAVTAIGVIQLAGSGVAVPTSLASAVICREIATAVSIVRGVGVLVIIT